MTALLQALFGTADVSPFALEVRARRREKNTPISRRWATSIAQVQTIARQFDEQGMDAYFGVALRKVVLNAEGRRIGTKESFARSSAAWIDLDQPDLPQILLPPSIIVSSGRGLHAYWLFDAPVEDPKRLELINQGLANSTGADKGCSDCVHILRVPGTHNHKYAQLIDVTEVYARLELRYSPDDLEALGKLTKGVIEAVTQEDYTGDRSKRDWGVVCDLVRAGFTDEAIQLIFQDWPVGEKMREVGPQYLEHTLMQARSKTESSEAPSGFNLSLIHISEPTRPY